MSNWSTLSSARTTRVAGLLALALSTGATAQAQHRARLSRDLADHLNGGARNGSANIEVIVDGAGADQLASKYNLRITRRLKSGRVLLVNAGQLAALQQDAGVDHLSATPGSVRRRWIRWTKRSAPIRCGRARARCQSFPAAASPSR